jgi:hypothetical protein
MLGYQCPTDGVEHYKQWIENEVGARIFRTIEILGDSSNGKTIAACVIVFIVPDQEFETMLTLKYPPNTFMNVDA